MALRCPDSVTGAAVMSILYGALGTLGGILAVSLLVVHFLGKDPVQIPLLGQMEADIPAFKLQAIANNVIGLLVGVSLLASGFFLLNLAKWVRTLTVAACVLAILTIICNLGYQTVFVLPYMNKTLPAVMARGNFAAKDAELIKTALNVGMYVGFAVTAASIIYLMIIVILLNTRRARAAFSGQMPADVDERRRDHDEDRGRPRDHAYDPLKTFLTREQVRAFDKHAIEQLGIPSAVLMENAGRGTAEVLKSLGIQGTVVIACGKGNNGGDGLVIARHLANAGADVLILLFARPEELSVDAALQWNIVKKMHLAVQVQPSSELNETALAMTFAAADWVVDALFGTGLSGPVRVPFDRVITLINGASRRVLAVDIPSGLDADTGEPCGPTIRAQHTVTFVSPKLGYRNPNATAWLGQVHVVDIGVGLAFTVSEPKA